MTQPSSKILQEKAVRMRRHIVRMAAEGKTSHVGSALSCADILAALFFHLMHVGDGPDDDRFILSKGHGAMALYAALAESGVLSIEDLRTYAGDGGYLTEHPSHLAKGISCTTGSLGHGLGIGAGQAWAKKMDGRKGRVFVVVSDGECNEGSLWEAAMVSARQGLGNLTVIVDDNHMQAMGPSRQISALEPFAKKWESFGWKVAACDGHDLDGLIKACNSLTMDAKTPTVLLARTVLAKGVDFMENDILWHYQVPSPEQMRLGLEGLGA